jgi:hypothetical protein
MCAKMFIVGKTKMAGVSRALVNTVMDLKLSKNAGNLTD